MTKHFPQIVADFATYAGLADDDARGQWSAADLAQYVYSNSDNIVSYGITAVGGDEYRVERMDGAYIILTLVSEYEGMVDGYTYTVYDTDADPQWTGGAPVSATSHLAVFAHHILKWADETTC